MLYSKAHFAVRHAASKDPGRYTINSVHFTEDGSTVATDGQMLIKVSGGHLPPEEFPENGIGDPEKIKPFTVPTPAIESIVKALPRKAQMPVLAYAALDTGATNANGEARFITTDLETVQEFKPRKIDGKFPDYEQVMPKGKPMVTIGINLDMIEGVRKAVKVLKPGNPVVKIEVFDELSPIRITAKDPDGAELTAIVMPCRL